MSGITVVARRAPRKHALVTVGRSVSFADLDDRQRAVAGGLAQAGLDPGDRIAVLSGNRVEYLELTLGALRAGIVPVPIHALLTDGEARYVIEDSGARWLFTDRLFEPLATLERIVTFGDAFERWLDQAPRADIASVALTRPMHYTSGTTGRAKGVWVAPSNEPVAAAASDRFRRLWGLSSDDVHLVCSPLSHSAPHRFCVRTLEAGGTVCVQERFRPEETLAAIELFGATCTFMVPTHLERILGLGDVALGRYDRSSLRLLAHAGAAIREPTKRRTIELFPPGSVWEFYGSTEGQATRISPEEWLAKIGSVGRALPGTEISIMDVEGRAVPAGDVGEIWIGGPAIERFEYWGDPDKTARAWRAGRFTVGDLGWLDDDGYLYLAGRKDDTIITGGVNVYPQEVEQALLRHPEVRDALVYGVDHDEWGQEVRALIVDAGRPIDTGELRAWLRRQLAAYKCPRRIDAVEELPRTPTGKLKRLSPDA